MNENETWNSKTYRLKHFTVVNVCIEEVTVYISNLIFHLKKWDQVTPETNKKKEITKKRDQKVESKNNRKEQINQKLIICKVQS